MRRTAAKDPASAVAAVAMRNTASTDIVVAVDQPSFNDSESENSYWLSQSHDPRNDPSSGHFFSMAGKQRRTAKRMEVRLVFVIL
jgi:hypothetical protein